MANSRLLSSFTITQASTDDLYVNYNGGGDTRVSIPAGTYWWSLDNSATDFGKVLETALAGVFGGTTWTAKIYGVDETGDYGDGRILIKEAAQDFVLAFNNAWTNLDPRLLGFAAASGAQSSASKKLTSEYVHRYGWYPQTDAVEDLITVIAHAAVAFTSARYRSGVDWGEWSTIALAFDKLHSPLVRAAAAADSTRNTGLGLTVGDENCAYEVFGRDLARAAEQAYRYYADATAHGTSDFNGPYVFPPDSPLWVDPLAISSITERAGELWMVALNGTEAVS